MQQTEPNPKTLKKKMLRLRKEMYELISEFREGLYCMELLKLYRERHNRELNFKKFGYEHVLGLTKGMEIIFLRSHVAGDTLLLDKEYSMDSVQVRKKLCGIDPPIKQQYSESDLEAQPQNPLNTGVLSPDCYSVNEFIPKLDTTDITVGTSIEISVTEVGTPSHMWAMKYGENYSKAAYGIMDKLNDFYVLGKGQLHFFPYSLMKVGVHCATWYEPDWHRSVIVQCIDRETVKVRHLDFGTVSTVERYQMRVLPRRFGALPAQAFRARLSGIRPWGGAIWWPAPATFALLELVTSKRMQAAVIAFDHKEKAFEFDLTDITENNSINVINEMVSTGHAQLTSDVSFERSEEYRQMRFNDLECGRMPNLSEATQCLRNGNPIPYVENWRDVLYYRNNVQQYKSPAGFYESPF